MECVRCGTTMVIQNSQTFTTTYSCPKPGCGNVCTADTKTKEVATWGGLAAAVVALGAAILGGGDGGGDA
jgi:hypothetical protein